MMKKIIRIIIVLLIFSCLGYLSACTKKPIYSGIGNPVHFQTYHFNDNIWNKLASQFNLPDETPMNPEVRKQINWYMHNKKYLIKIAKRSAPYLYYISQQVKQRNLPAELALLPIIESEYEPLAYSKVGAAGLWQIMPGTASGFGLKIDWWYDGRRDIVASTSAALDYFSYLGNFFNNNWNLAFAAYDAGDGAINAAIHRNAKAGKPVDFWHLHLSKETTSYVPKLLALATIIKYPQEYPIDLPPIKNAPYLAEVDIGSQINLTQAAKMANISLKELIKLNPAYNHWATDPSGKHKLLLSIDKVATFQAHLHHFPKSKRVTWKRYKVKNGDSLLSIAHKFKTTPSLLRHANRLKNDKIYQNHALLIPTATERLTQSILRSERKIFHLNKKIPELKIIQHQVKSGDSLWTIAKKYHVKPKQILFWNGLKSYKSLRVGKKLIIWPPRKHYRTATYNIHYKVRHGDSLFSIARRYHITTTKLKTLNHLKNSNLRIGQVLLVKRQTVRYVKHKTPKYRSPKRIVYHVHSGDTLSGIALHHHVTVAKLEHWNRIDTSKHLKIHQELVMYR
jgi:membrane-bound lytic murein transglycosylase D